MLRLRLQRRGKKNYATYKVVVADQHAPIKGKFLASIGHYNPHTNSFVVNTEEVTKWINQGAQPTPTVHNLLVTNKVIKGEKVTSWSAKKKLSEEAAATPSPTEPTPETAKVAPAEKPDETAK